MCPEKPAFFENTIWEAIFNSRFEFWWCNYYWNAWWLIILAIFSAVLTLFLIVKLIDAEAPPSESKSPNVAAEIQRVAERLKPLWWVTSALLIVILVSLCSAITTVFPNWTLWALGTRDYDSIYALSPDGVQYVLDSLEWNAWAGLFSFLSATLTCLAVCYAFRSQILDLIRHNPRQPHPTAPTLNPIPQAAAATLESQKQKPSLNKKSKAPPQTEWTPIPYDRGTPLPITHYKEDGTVEHVNPNSGEGALKLNAKKIVISRDGFYFWSDRRPVQGEHGADRDQITMIYRWQSGGPFYFAPAIKEGEEFKLAAQGAYERALPNEPFVFCFDKIKFHIQFR